MFISHSVCTSGGSAKWIDGAEADGLTNVGENIVLTIEVTNDGSATLSELCVTGDRLADGCQKCEAPKTLTPEESLTGNLDYEVPDSWLASSLMEQVLRIHHVPAAVMSWDRHNYTVAY